MFTFRSSGVRVPEGPAPARRFGRRAGGHESRACMAWTLLLLHQPTSGANELPGHPTPVLTDEESHDIRDILRLTQAAQRRHVDGLLDGLRWHDHPVRVGEPGQYGIHPDAARAELLGERQAKLLDRRLGPQVQTRPRAARYRTPARDCDYAPAVAKPVGRLLKGEKGAPRDEPEYPVELLLTHLGVGLENTDGGVVYHYVHTPKALLGGLKQAPSILHPSYVGLDGD